jgi:hypothetical protein
MRFIDKTSRLDQLYRVERAGTVVALVATSILYQCQEER